MCFDHDSRPPITPIAGGALAGRRIEVDAPDGNRFAAFHARASVPGGAAIVILPDVRGLHPYYEGSPCASRSAASTHWRSTGSAGPRAPSRARRASSTCPTSNGRPGRGSRPTSPPPSGRCARRRVARPGRVTSSPSGSAWAAPWRSCRRRASRARRAIGLYGTVAGPWRNDAPAPVDLAASFENPALGLSGGADAGITAQAVAAFDGALGAAGVERRIDDLSGCAAQPLRPQVRGVPRPRAKRPGARSSPSSRRTARRASVQGSCACAWRVMTVPPARTPTRPDVSAWPGSRRRMRGG